MSDQKSLGFWVFGYTYETDILILLMGIIDEPKVIPKQFGSKFGYRYQPPLYTRNLMKFNEK